MLATDEVLQERDADDVVHRLPDDRDTREAAAQRERDALRDGLGALDPDHVGAGHHHLAGQRVTELEDRRDHVALAALHDAALLGEVDQIAQLGFGGERALRDSRGRA